MAPVFPERDIGEGFEERFNILVKRANTRGEYRIGSQKGFADTNKLNVACVVQNGNKLLDNKNPSPKDQNEKDQWFPAAKELCLGRMKRPQGGRIAASSPQSSRHDIRPFKCGNINQQELVVKAVRVCANKVV